MDLLHHSIIFVLGGVFVFLVFKGVVKGFVKGK